MYYNYFCDFPFDSDPVSKARLIGATFLISKLFYNWS
jgi:hypothetical protein